METSGHAAQPLWLSQEQLQRILKNTSERCTGSQQAAAQANSQEHAVQETYLLGRHPDGHFCLAASLPAGNPDAAEAAVQQEVPAATAMDTRALMGMSDASNLAIIGHAIALVTWHNVRFLTWCAHGHTYWRAAGLRTCHVPCC